MLLKFLVIIFLTILIPYETAKPKTSPMVLVVKRLQQCQGKENITCLIKTVHITQKSKYEQVLNGEIAIKDGMSPNLDGYYVTADISKCDDAQAMMNCEPFFSKIRVTNICEMFGHKSEALKAFIDFVEPVLKCPLRGNYKIKDIKISPELMRFGLFSTQQQKNSCNLFYIYFCCSYLPVVSFQSFDAVFKLIDGKTKILHACVNFAIVVKRKRN